MKQNITYKHFHDRLYGWGKPDQGGFTMCVDWERKVIGFAVCSEKDQYCKKTGREIARDRVEEQCGDGSIVIVTMPTASSKRAMELQRDAKGEAFWFIDKNFPNMQFGFTFEE